MVIMNQSNQFHCQSFEGKDAGPRLLITAGVHGDEFLPVLAVRNLIKRLEQDVTLVEGLRGAVSLIPVVNRSAFRLGDRCGEDGKDLARSCPGRADGTLTEQVAHALSAQIQQADFYIDLHTGGTEFCVQPLAGYMLHEDDRVLEQQRGMARAFGMPVTWGTSAGLQGRSLSVARDRRIPAIYVEYLGGHREISTIVDDQIDPLESAQPLVEGCLNVMRHLGILDESAEYEAGQVMIEDWREESGHMQVCNPAPVSGLLRPLVKIGQQVRRGDLLAEVAAVVGDEVHQIKSARDGLVVVVREYPRICKGDTVAVIAEGQEQT